MRYRVVAFAAAFTLLAAAHQARTAHACSCAPPPDAITHFNAASAVFTGDVKTITETEHGFAVTFTVTQMYKGPAGAEVTIHTARDSAACGYNFEQAKSYLVYAFGEPTELSVNICGRTAPVDAAAADIAAIDAMMHGNGKPAPEDPPADPPPTDTVDPGAQPPPPQTVQRKGCGCDGTGRDAGTGLVLLFAAALAVRRRVSSSAR